MVKACEYLLGEIDTIAPTLRWSENDPPAKDILRARLQAKFYGAKVITYRRFVLKVFQYSDTPNATTEIEPEVVNYAEKCIHALIKSTTAFHGLGDPGKKRLVVTNIWGTAMAYVDREYHSTITTNQI